MSGAKKYDFSAFDEAVSNQKQTPSDTKYDFSSFDNVVKKKEDGEELENGGQAGTSPTPSPLSSPLKRAKWEENPLNPLAAVNKAQAKKEAEEKIMPRPTPTVGKTAPAKVAPQRKPIAEHEDGVIQNVQDFGKYVWNKTLEAVGRVGAGTGELLVDALSLTDDPNFPKEELVKTYREEIAPKFRQAPEKYLGAELPKEKIKKFDDNFVTSVIGGVPGVIAEAAIPFGAGFIADAIDSGIQTINDSEEGKKLPESQKTIFGIGSGIAMGALTALGIDKIFGKQSSKIANKLAMETFSKLISESKEPITKEIFEAAIKNNSKSLYNKIISTGGKLGESALVGSLFTGGIEVTNEIAKQTTNALTKKDVFDPFSWGKFTGNTIRSMAHGAATGFVLGAATIPFSKAENAIKNEVLKAKNPQDIENLKTQIVEQVGKGTLDPMHAESIGKLIDSYSSANAKVPSNVENRDSVVDLVKQKDDLKQAATDKLEETKVVDDAFHPQIQQEATVLLNRANELNESITGQPSEPAKHSIYADPLEIPELKEQIDDINRRVDLGGADGEKAKQELAQIKEDPIKFYEDRKQLARENLTDETELPKTLEAYDNIINKIKDYDKENKSRLSGSIKKREEPVTTEPIKGAGAEETGAGGVLQAPGAEGEGERVGEKVGEEVKKGDKIQWDVYGNEDAGEWTIGDKVKTRGGQDAVILSKEYVTSSSDGKTYTKEYADANGIKYDNTHIVEHTVPLSELPKQEQKGVGDYKVSENKNGEGIVFEHNNGFRALLTSKGKELEIKVTGIPNEADRGKGWGKVGYESIINYAKNNGFDIVKSAPMLSDQSYNVWSSLAKKHNSIKEFESNYDLTGLVKTNRIAKNKSHIFEVNVNEFAKEQLLFAQELKSGLPKQEQKGVGEVEAKVEVPELTEEEKTNKKLEELGSRQVPEGKGNWRDAFNKEKDAFRKSSILRAIADSSKNIQELTDIREAAKEMPNESNIIYAVDRKLKSLGVEITKEKPSPKEGDIVILPPQIKGGVERKMVFNERQWKQEVGGKPTGVGEMVKQQAQKKWELGVPKQEFKPEVGMKEEKALSLESKKEENARPEKESAIGEVKINSEKVRYNGTDAIGSRTRTKSEQTSSRNAAKEKIKNPETNASLKSANSYNQSVGLPEVTTHKYKPSDPIQQTKIAKLYPELQDVNSHTYKETDTERRIYSEYKSKHPEIFKEYDIKDYKDLVHKAYGQLIKETQLQYDALPVKVTFHEAGEGNYQNNFEMLDDVHNFNHLWVYKGGDDHTELGSKTMDKNGLTANDKFRAVHDYYGHSIEGYQFGKDGEENAWIEHSKMFSPLAQWALSSETRGQNSWVNYSGVNDVVLQEIKLGSALKSQGEKLGNQEMIDEGEKLLSTIYDKFQFAQQKAIILPPEFTDISKFHEVKISEIPEQLKKEKVSEPIREEVSRAVQPTPEVPKEQETKTGVQPSAEPISKGGTEAAAPILKEGEAEVPKHNKDNQPEFTTSNGRQKVNRVGDELIVTDSKTGKKVSRVTEKKAILEYTKNFDFTYGEEGESATQSQDPNKILQEVVETSSNPHQLAVIYAENNLPFTETAMDVPGMIAEYGIGKTSLDSYRRFGDINKLSSKMRANYIAKRGEEAMPIDVYAKELSDYYFPDGDGTEISPQDIVDFMEKYESKKELAQKKNPLLTDIENKFKKLTGLKLTNETANIAIGQKIEKESQLEQNLLKQDYENQQQLEDEYWKQYKATDGFTKEASLAEIDKSKEGIGEKEIKEEAEKMPPSPPKPPISPEGKIQMGGEEVRGITVEENKERRKDLGMPERQPNPETFEQWDNQAKKLIEDGYNMNILIEKMEAGEATTPVENSLRKIFAATIDKELTTNSSDEFLAQAKRFTEASDKASSQAGKNLVSLKGNSAPLETITDFYMAKMDANGVDVLTEQQKKDVQEQFDKINRLNKDFEIKLKEAEDKNAELLAQNELLKQQKGKAKPKVPKQKKDFIEERQSLKDQLKQAIQNYKNNANKLGISSDGGAENFAITVDMAKIIAKIVKSHVDEVGAKLAEVTKRTLDDVKDLFDGITEKDIRDIIAGKYSESKKTKSQLQADLNDIKSEARLLNEYERVLKGEAKTEKDKVKKNQKLTDLRKSINELKKEKGVEQYSDEAKIEQAKKAVQKNISDLERRLAENDIEFKKKKSPTNSELESYRDKQKELRKELEGIKKEQKVGQYSDEAKAKRMIEANKKKEQQIKEKLANEDFEKEDKPKSLFENQEFKNKNPELYKKLLDSYTAKQDALHEYEVALLNDSQAKMSKGQKILDYSSKAVNTTKKLVTGVDDSALFMQTLVAMMSRPVIGGKAFVSHIKEAASQKLYERNLAELHNSPMFDLMQKSGLDITEPKTLSAKAKEEAFAGESLDFNVTIKGKKHKVLGTLLEPFERAFTSLGNNMRAIAFTELAEKYINEGYTFENNPKVFKDLATMLNTETGRGKQNEYIEKASKLVTAGIWSPRLMASRLNLLGISDLLSPFVKGTKGYYRELSPEIRKQAIYSVAKFTAAIIAISYSAAYMFGGEVDDDPTSQGFMDIKIGDKTYNIAGGFSQYIRLIAQTIMGGKTTDGKFKEFRSGDRSGNMLHFLRGKLTPVSGVAADVMSGMKDYVGQPVTIPQEIKKLTIPLSMQGVATEMERDGIASILKSDLPSFVGIGVKDVRDFKTKETLSKDELGTPGYKIYEEKGIELPGIGSKNQIRVSNRPDGVMTDEEYTKYSELVNKYVKDGWEDEDGNHVSSLSEIPQRTFKIKQKGEATEEVLGKDLSKDDLEEKVSQLFQKARAKAKEDLGLSVKKPRRTITEEK